jgi:hypothetical protein
MTTKTPVAIGEVISIAADCAEPNGNLISAYVNPGFYKCEKLQFYSDRAMPWYLQSAIKRTIERIRTISFMYQDGRNTILAEIASLQSDAPYNLTERFPKRDNFIRGSDEFSKNITKLTNAAQTRDWFQLATSAGVAVDNKTMLALIEKLEKASQVFSSALQALFACFENKDYIFNRERFEKDYGLKWIEGDINCYKESISLTHLQEYRCPSFGDLRGFFNIWDVWIDPITPHTYATKIFEHRMLNIEAVTVNQALPASGFYVYRRNPPDDDRKVLRVTYTNRGLISYETIDTYKNVTDYEIHDLNSQENDEDNV